MEAIRIDEAIEALKEIREEHGNLELVKPDGEVLTSIEARKYILMSNDKNERINRQTCSINEDYLDKKVENPEYSKHLVYKGICVKLF